LVPDLGTFRDRFAAKGDKLRAIIYGVLSLGWRGSARNWHRYERAYLILAGLATPLVFSVHSVVSFDFATSQLPGWHTTIFPPYFAPAAIPGMASSPKFKGRPVAGVRIKITDQSILRPVETGVAVMAALYAALPATEQQIFFRKGLDLMAGTDRLQRSLEFQRSPDEIQNLWRVEVDKFRQTRAPYLLYGP
jgi:hypothetical protein